MNGHVITLCNNCLLSLKDGRLPKLALSNHLHVGLIPPELQSLSIVEEAMISLMCQKGVILQLREDNTKCPNVNAQQGFTGHTIYFPQDTQFVTTILPPPVDELLKYICILFVGSSKPSQEFLLKHAHPLAVCPNKVCQALVWLKAHNFLYRDIIINDQALVEIERNEGIPFVIEHVDQSVVNDDTMSGNFPHESSFCDGPSSENDCLIPLERLVIADLNAAPTSVEMHAAAIRHLQHGKPYLQIGHGRIPETDYHYFRACI